MRVLLATATHGDPVLGQLILAGAALIWLAGYLLACYVWPFKTCRLCDGSGKRRSPSGRAWRRCWWCKGSGGRLRIARRIWNYYRRVHADSSR